MREKYFYIAGIVIALCTICFIILQSMGMLSLDWFSLPCTFRHMTGIYCPGCGATRAVKTLFHGHFLECLMYHPFIFYCAFVYFWFMFSHSLEIICKKVSPHKKPFVRGISIKLYFVYLGVVILLGQWLIKNIILICTN